MNDNNKMIMYTRVYPPNKGGVEIVAKQYVEYFKKMNYTVEVICMDFNINKRIVKKELKNEKIIYVKPIINIQSVHISFIYIFILFYKYLISKKILCF